MCWLVLELSVGVQLAVASLNCSVKACLQDAFASTVPASVPWSHDVALFVCGYVVSCLAAGMECEFEPAKYRGADGLFNLHAACWS